MNLNLVLFIKLIVKIAPTHTYIGESGQYLKKRMHQHNYDIKRKKNASALTNHVFENQHNFDFNNVKIIDTLRIYQNLIDTIL
jgi:hypothetical protein